MYKFFVKRLIDLVIALIALFISFPLFMLIFIFVKLDSKGPFFFLQERLGYKGTKFKVYKIRTMTHKERISHQEVLKNNLEVTSIGSLLRRFKIDELPQLINIFKGDMSIVGPRPGLPDQENEFNDDGKMRLLVKPGLTGLAQVNGNILLSWPERWKFDRQYVENLSMLLDIKIVSKTILIIFFGEEKFLKKPDA